MHDRPATIADDRMRWREPAGPPVRVTPKQALALSMAFHELSTNAAKHGALSVPDGRVAVTWTGDGECEVRWFERGGPPVSPPTRRGFGTRVLNRALALELDRPVDLRFDPAGVACALRFEVAPDTRAALRSETATS